MPLKRARPIDEVIEIAGVDDDYDDLGGREERIERRKKRRARRKTRRSKRLKKDAGRLRRESKVVSSRSSRRKSRRSRKKTSKRSYSEAPAPEPMDSLPYEDEYAPYEEGYDDVEEVWEEEYWPEDEYDPEDFEDPYEDYLEDYYADEFEGEFAGRKKRGKNKGRRAGRKNWEKPAFVGKLRIHAKKGHRAAIRELEDGLFLVAEVGPGKVENLKKLREASLAGDGDPELGALSLIAKLASMRAKRLLNKESPAQTEVPMMVPATVPAVPSAEPAHPWYDKSKVPPGVGGAVVTQPGDTMWGIASKHLGSGMRWNQVYLVNASQLQGKKATDPLSAGMVLWLPVAPTGNWLSA
jgi:nucleoid-associated protein YgaU